MIDAQVKNAVLFKKAQLLHVFSEDQKSQEKELDVQNNFLYLENDENDQLKGKNKQIVEFIPSFYEKLKENLKQRTDEKEEERNIDNFVSDRIISQDFIGRLGFLLSERDNTNNNLRDIISIINGWLPEIKIHRIVHRINSNQLLLESSAKMKELTVKFYMKVTLSNLKELNQMKSEQDAFKRMSSRSAQYFSMKYQKVISEYLILTDEAIMLIKGQTTFPSHSSPLQFAEIVLLELCQFTLREILYGENNLNTQDSEMSDISLNNCLLNNQINNITTNTTARQSQALPSSLIQKFSFQYLQKDLIESLFFMHTGGCTHNNISIDNIFYDKYINAFLIGGFGKVEFNIQDYDSFRKDVVDIGKVLLQFLAVHDNYQEDLQSIKQMSALQLHSLTQALQFKQHPLRKTFILLNLNLYEQRNILFDIFPLPQSRSFDIVELAICLNIQSCLSSSSHQLMRIFIQGNQVYNENEIVSNLKDPLDPQVSLWRYKGEYKNGYFEGKGEIYFKEQKIFEGEWECGLTSKYLSFVPIEQFELSFSKSNYIKVSLVNEHQQLTFQQRDDSLSHLLPYDKKLSIKQRVIDLKFSNQKGSIIDCLNVLIKYFQIPLTNITFDQKHSNSMRSKEDKQVILMKGKEYFNLDATSTAVIASNSTLIVFENSYEIKEEEFYIILEKATLSSQLELIMSHSLIGDKLFYGMSFNPKLKNLTHLHIPHSTRLTDEGFLNFLRNCPSPLLSSLDLSYTNLTNYSLSELAISSKVCKLQHLSIAHCLKMNEPSVIAFIKSSNSLMIQSLNLAGIQDISDQFIEILCISPFMKSITSIILNDCHKITFKIFENLSKSDSVNCIQRIELSNCLRHTQTVTKKAGFFGGLLDKRQGKMDFKSFTKTEKLGKLFVLNLQGCQISYHHIKQLASSHSLKSLEELNVSHCEDFNDECIREICISSNFSKLKVLNLNNIKGLTFLSLEMMGGTKVLSHLEQLHISGCEKIDKEAILQILKYKNFQKLFGIEFDENQYSLNFLRTISFSNKNSIHTFANMQQLQLHVFHPEQFFKVNISDILAFNQKPIKFVVIPSQEIAVIGKLAAILSSHYFNVKECCHMSVNSVEIDDKLVEEFKSERNSKRLATSISNADAFSNGYRPFLANRIEESQQIISYPKESEMRLEKLLHQNQSQQLFREMNSQSKTECFKAMSQVEFLSQLTKLDLSESKNINLAGFQFIKECSFFSLLIELNLSSLPIQNKHVAQLCFGSNFTSLRILNLSNCSNLTFEAFDKFLNAGLDSTLQFLDVTGSKIEGTAFCFSLPQIIKLTQLNEGIVNIKLQHLCINLLLKSVIVIRKKEEIIDEENAKDKISQIFEKIKQLFFISELHVITIKMRQTSQIQEGITFILENHFNTITSFSISMKKQKNMNSEKSVNFWSGISSLSKLTKLCLKFESCKVIDKLFLRNMFFGISVLGSLEELRIALPSTEIIIEPEDCAPLCDLMTKLQKIIVLDIDFSNMPSKNSQFLEEFNGIIGKFENKKYLSLNYSKNTYCSQSTFIKLIESLESSTAKLYFLSLDFGMCSLGNETMKRMKKYIYSQFYLRDLHLDISYCIELKEKTALKLITKCLEIKMLKAIKLNFAGRPKIPLRPIQAFIYWKHLIYFYKKIVDQIKKKGNVIMPVVINQ